MLWCISTVWLKFTGPRPPRPGTGAGGGGPGAGPPPHHHGRRRRLGLGAAATRRGRGHLDVDVFRERDRALEERACRVAASAAAPTTAAATTAARRELGRGRHEELRDVDHRIAGGVVGRHRKRADDRRVVGDVRERVVRIRDHRVVDVLEQDTIPLQRPAHHAAADRLSAVAGADRVPLDLRVPEEVLPELVLRDLIEQRIVRSGGDAVHLEDAVIRLRLIRDDLRIRPRPGLAPAATARLGRVLRRRRRRRILGEQHGVAKHRAHDRVRDHGRAECESRPEGDGPRLDSSLSRHVFGSIC
jgi:hypothetical protein